MSVSYKTTLKMFHNLNVMIPLTFLLSDVYSLWLLSSPVLILNKFQIILPENVNTEICLQNFLRPPIIIVITNNTE